MCHQNSCRFYNCIAYDRDYSGLSHDDEEGMRTGRQLGDKSVLFMCNHGVLVVAETAAKAFDDIYYLERACMTQVRCWLLHSLRNRRLKEYVRKKERDARGGPPRARPVLSCSRIAYARFYVDHEYFFCVIIFTAMVEQA